jgi:predicted small secreted protein
VIKEVFAEVLLVLCLTVTGSNIMKGLGRDIKKPEKSSTRLLDNVSAGIFIFH